MDKVMHKLKNLDTQIHILTTVTIVLIVGSLFYNPMIILYALVSFFAIGACLFFYGIVYDTFKWLLTPRDPNDDGFTDEPGP